ncbi:uncharacterized protein LOC132744577 [Ruditapes philippinarum]|uniref:uncharacterized protein LOC132744577 n=1 Tax=Ruditapes philippinarum TaxID=129788 RepID=UPI00295B6396|nr:uncharacterized protein LOC132744577 [Ruditapes philippinarum]
MNCESDNFILRETCILNNDFDILALAETHLTENKFLNITGYQWFGHNRKHIHRNARTGSGGVGFLIRNSICDNFNINILSDTCEGILWLKMVHKSDDFTLLPCVCYLPPENSSRQFDVNRFYESLLTDIYTFQNEGLVFICGDFNSRCGDLEDYIVGVDDIPSRNVIDYKTNFYGEMFIDFLINANFCMLNGRTNSSNEFTSVSVKGSSVVDYCVVTHDSLSKFTDFSVKLTSDVINSSCDINSLAPTCLPDHSLLSWNIVCNSANFIDDISCDNVSYDKFNLNMVPGDFLTGQDIIDQVNNVIENLEQGLQSQSDIDGLYSEWCSIIKHNMYKDVPYKTVSGVTVHKKFKHGKPWWSPDLTNLWNVMCFAERKWLKCVARNEKLKLKSEFVQARRHFDREVQKAKRLYWYTMQNELLDECNVDQSKFWQSIGKIGIGHSKGTNIPMQVVFDNGTTSSSVSDILSKWKHDFSSVFNNTINNVNNDQIINDDQINESDVIQESFNNQISILEVKKAIDKAKLKKATGFDKIPSEVLKNDTTVVFLHALFNVCFDKGIVPSVWNKCLINPIPKSSTADGRDPLSYRGISLTCSMYKLYCNILNDRLSSWSEANNIIVDEQNGFRRKRSTTDHISSLVNLIDTRKKMKKSTFTAFIDFRKAYDLINRSKLWSRLQVTGVCGKMLRAIKSLYSSLASCVRINSFTTDWFDVHCGLRQGCVLSPLLFNLYINDLALYLKSLNIGVTIDDEIVCILLYADDIVLLAETERDLQCLLNGLHDWCSINDMSINTSKSNIVHFRPESCTRSDFVFKCGHDTLSYADKYKYLGIVLHEHVDFNVTARMVAQSASRALGLLIAKCKLVGGVPHSVFTKLYDSVVWPVIAYGASLWGHKSYSCINAVHNRAMRVFLGVGKYTPNAAVSGDMGWVPPLVRQWKSVAIFWVRLSQTNTCRLNKRIELWSLTKGAPQCKNWFYHVQKQWNELNLGMFCDLSSPIAKTSFVRQVESLTMEGFKAEWIRSVNCTVGPSGRGLNKLRTYRTFKQEHTSEEYCKMILPPRHRSAFCKFRCGVAPIRIETGRYENLRLDERHCPFCNVLEDEQHVILDCPVYDDFRSELISKAVLHEPSFINFSKDNQLAFLFSSQPLVRKCAKTCFNILQRRQSYLCK